MAEELLIVRLHAGELADLGEEVLLREDTWEGGLVGGRRRRRRREGKGDGRESGERVDVGEQMEVVGAAVVVAVMIDVVVVGVVVGVVVVESGEGGEVRVGRVFEDGRLGHGVDVEAVRERQLEAPVEQL